MKAEELGLHPEREADRALLHALRPAGWRNPVARDRYHLVVLGGGTGGLVTAAAAAALGARVALVERRLLGGDCLNVGCVPSKSIVRAAAAWAGARGSAAEFGAPTLSGGGDAAVAFERMRRVRAAIAPHDGAERFRGLGVDVFLGDARFASRNAVDVDGQRLSFWRAVIATGTRPVVPDVPGLAEAGYLTNETVFGLDRPPETLAVIGGGPIGCELAQAFARLGSRVALIEVGERLLSAEDPQAVEIVADALRRDGVEVRLATALTSVRRDGDLRTLSLRGADGVHSEIVTDAVLVATGRMPNVESLALDRAGVGMGRDGVEVNDRLRTANRRVFAVGDVVGVQRFTHLADAHARLVVANALFFGRGRASALVVPRCTYTDPELAHVGLTPADAVRRHLSLDTIAVPMDAVDRARIDGNTEGMLRVHLASGSDRIVGATLVGPHAGDMIAQVAAAMVNRVGLGGIGRAIHPYPTYAEVFRKAADALRRRKLTPRAARLFGWYFRLMR
jgi:pyruvate/2-oxoglutarate dehydrogenase complex dihydrolipoamide dehydrogenase (E3) component